MSTGATMVPPQGGLSNPAFLAFPAVADAAAAAPDAVSAATATAAIAATDAALPTANSADRAADAIPTGPVPASPTRLTEIELSNMSIDFDDDAALRKKLKIAAATAANQVTVIATLTKSLREAHDLLGGIRRDADTPGASCATTIVPPPPREYLMSAPLLSKRHVTRASTLIYISLLHNLLMSHS